MGEGLQLRVGEYYRDRAGRVKGPLLDNNDAAYPFTDGSTSSWTGTGQFCIGSEEMNSDLIEEVGAPAIPPVAATGPDPVDMAPAHDGEARRLRVSVWFAFAPVTADVTVHPDKRVDVNFAALEPRAFPGRIALDAADLDKLAIIRSTGHIPLRGAIEARALEEAFA